MKKQQLKNKISQQKKNKKNDKKASLKTTLIKIVDVVKKPFQKKNTIEKTKQKNQLNDKHKKPRKEKILIQHENANEKIDNSIINEDVVSNKIQEQLGDIPFAENSAITQLSKFFYSNDRFIETFDDTQLYDAITKHYPGLLAKESNEQTKRKAIIDLLNDNDFMANILENYNMNVLDFFKFLFRLCPSIFKGFFVKKVQKTLKNKKYTKNVKFSQYKFQRRGKKKKKLSRRCSLF